MDFLIEFRTRISFWRPTDEWKSLKKSIDRNCFCLARTRVCRICVFCATTWKKWVFFRISSLKCKCNVDKMFRVVLVVVFLCARTHTIQLFEQHSFHFRYSISMHFNSTFCFVSCAVRFKCCGTQYHGKNAFTTTTTSGQSIRIERKWHAKSVLPWIRIWFSSVEKRSCFVLLGDFDLSKNGSNCKREK